MTAPVTIAVTIRSTPSTRVRVTVTTPGVLVMGTTPDGLATVTSRYIRSTRDIRAQEIPGPLLEKHAACPDKEDHGADVPLAMICESGPGDCYTICMNKDGRMNEDDESPLKFPCQFPIKAMGKSDCDLWAKTS